MNPVAMSLVVLLASANPASAQQIPQQTPVTPTASETIVPAPLGAVAPSRPILSNTLMDGTPLALRLTETISSGDAHVGQNVPFEVTEDIVVDGVTIIPKGSSAVGTVTVAEPKKSMGRGGKLDVVIDSVRLIDGTKVQLSATKNTSGGGHIGAMTTAMVATSIIFFPAAPLFLFIHGKDITIPKGTPITAFAQGDTKLDMARLTGKPSEPASPPASQEAVTAVAGTATLQIESNIPGADIEIDGAFVGSTPSTLNAGPGQHTITVKKKGYVDWTRTMKVNGSAVHINAELDKSR